MRVLSKIFTVLFYIEIVVMTVLTLLCFAGKPFGFNNYAVVSGSMVPTIQVGSMSYIDTNVPAAQLQKGDIVAFFSDEARTKPVMHRIVAIDASSKTFTTKGDANDAPDITPVSYDAVIGKFDTNIPYLGFICDFISEKGIAVALIILATALLSIFLPRFVTTTRKH